VSAYPLEYLHEENKVQGYATYRLLDAITPSESSGLRNQPGATDHDASKPQWVQMSWGTKRMPTDFYKWEVAVTIDPAVEFFKQHVVLKHCYRTYSHGDKCYLQEDEYEVDLAQLVRILPLLKKKSKRRTVLRTLKCRDVSEYVFDAEEVPAN